MKELRDSHKVFGEHGVVVLGVSVDSVEKHKKFRESLDLPFDLLSDKDRSLHKAYGFNRFSRAFVLIDKGGVIRYVEKRYRLKREQWERLLAAVRTLQK